MDKVKKSLRKKKSIIRQISFRARIWSGPGPHVWQPCTQTFPPQLPQHLLSWPITVSYTTLHCIWHEPNQQQVIDTSFMWFTGESNVFQRTLGNEPLRVFLKYINQHNTRLTGTGGNRGNHGRYPWKPDWCASDSTLSLNDRTSSRHLFLLNIEKWRNRLCEKWVNRRPLPSEIKTYSLHFPFMNMILYYAIFSSFFPSIWHKITFVKSPSC